jgi:hypothetical protein
MYGRHSNEWLFNGVSVKRKIKNALAKVTGRGEERR